MPARQNAPARANRLQLAVLDVRDFHFLGRIHVAQMADPRHRAVQTNASAGSSLIQPRVIGAGGHHVIHRIARNRGRQQFPDQQACDGRVAIGEMKPVLLRLFILN